jgi:Tfp pilus assembly protein PilW
VIALAFGLFLLSATLGLVLAFLIDERRHDELTTWDAHEAQALDLVADPQTDKRQWVRGL